MYVLSNNNPFKFIIFCFTTIKYKVARRRDFVILPKTKFTRKKKNDCFSHGETPINYK